MPAQVSIASILPCQWLDINVQIVNYIQPSIKPNVRSVLTLYLLVPEVHQRDKLYRAIFQWV
jgi:hypothetical protein